MIQEQEIQKLTIEAQKRLFLTGVVSVDGFTETTLKLTLTNGRALVLGDKIKITAFNKATGNLQADGEFYQVKFENAKAPFLKRVFK